MTTTKPGILTPSEFNTLMGIIALLFITFFGGTCFGVYLHKKAVEEVLEIEVPITTTPHLPTIEGGYLS